MCVLYMEEKKSVEEKKNDGEIVSDVQKSSRGLKLNMFQKWFRWCLIKFVLIAVAAVVVLCAVTVGYRKLTAVHVEKKSAEVMSELIQCQELSVIKNRYSDIITIKKTRIAGLARSFSIVRYSGIIRAGIADLSASQISVSKDGKSVTIKLPKAEILGNDISSLEVFDEYKSVFVSISTQEIFDQVNKSREETVQDLVNAGLLDDAQNRAKELITRVLFALGFKKVTVQ